eukprot:CAMPEP_0183594624 /NCGR_PEP_ID=MMETSP0371-20130417/172016_1 /TAXON_ID=268820 /ORGANISM="Peridinium aciculiferum, Strain PAER-2" /LENGTH=308 /DNA_ID=CAMNT_0025806357 /DNA_START=31 /DNA_END=954 /DNA_ORIENTATION=-
MEVILAGIEGGAAEDPNCHISVKVGGTRRQGPLQVGKPLRFPGVTLQHAQPFKVDLLRQLGVGELASIPNDGLYVLQLAPANVPAAALDCGTPWDAERAAAEAAPTPTLTLRITSRPLQCTSRKGGEHTSDKSSLSARLDAGLVAKLQEDEDRGIDADANVVRVAQAKTFFEDHNLLSVMQAMLEAMAREQPDDPWDFVAEFMERLAVAPLEGCSCEAPATKQSETTELCGWVGSNATEAPSTKQSETAELCGWVASNGTEAASPGVAALLPVAGAGDRLGSAVGARPVSAGIGGRDTVGASARPTSA